MSEYIKKEDVLVYLEKWKIGHIEDKEHYPINYGTLLDMMFFIRRLPTYSIPDSAKTDTAKPGSDLISRTQAINDYAQCFADEYGMDCGEMFIGVLHQCPTFPDSAEDNTMEWIAEENEEMEITGYFCSKCDLPSPNGEKTDFCPNCGRKAVANEV